MSWSSMAFSSPSWRGSDQNTERFSKSVKSEKNTCTAVTGDSHAWHWSITARPNHLDLGIARYQGVSLRGRRQRCERRAPSYLSIRDRGASLHHNSWHVLSQVLRGASPFHGCSGGRR